MRNYVRVSVAGAALLAALTGTAWATSEQLSSASPTPVRGTAGYSPEDDSEGERKKGPFAPRDCAAPRVRPTRIVLRCESYGILINGINWKSWRSRSAKGKGLLHVRDCRPSCEPYPVKVEVHKVRRTLCEAERLAMFKRIKLEFPRQDPNFANNHKKLFCSP